MTTTPDFDLFWSAWPNNSGRYARKGGKKECFKIWTKNYNSTQVENIIAHVNWMKTTEAWLRDEGAYIPMPITYLRQARWDGADIPTKARAAPTEYERTKAVLKELERMPGRPPEGYWKELRARARGIQ